MAASSRVYFSVVRGDLRLLSLIYPMKVKKRKGEKTACRLVKFFIEKDLGKDYGIYK
ncbi:hypothetical protein [Treponema sp. SP13]|uniref:hypothetical protein n=1 Tax=Treponema sp. SP13 TaxID=2789742 RepID=UPI003D9363C4